MLIIRSAGFQQIDQNLPRLQERFPECQVTLLTHSHGVQMAEKYSTLHSVCEYPYKQGFHYRRRVTAFRQREFDTVIIPVSNLSGSGFFNVLLFSLTIPAKRRYVCNMVSEIREISSLQVLGMGARHVMFTILSGMLAGLLGLFSVLLLPIALKRILKKK
jgi:hypothetical protein